MATIKSFTSLEQSKKLTEILPLESADMWWSKCTITDFGDGVLKVSYAVEPCNISQFRNTKEDVPCWSLSALLNVLPNDTSLLYFDDAYQMVYDKKPYVISNKFDNPIDACYEMIINLHEMNLL